MDSQDDDLYAQALDSFEFAAGPQPFRAANFAATSSGAPVSRDASALRSLFMSRQAQPIMTNCNPQHQTASSSIEQPQQHLSMAEAAGRRQDRQRMQGPDRQQCAQQQQDTPPAAPVQAQQAMQPPQQSAAVILGGQQQRQEEQRQQQLQNVHAHADACYPAADQRRAPAAAPDQSGMFTKPAVEQNVSTAAAAAAAAPAAPALPSSMHTAADGDAKHPTGHVVAALPPEAGAALAPLVPQAELAGRAAGVPAPAVQQQQQLQQQQQQQLALTAPQVQHPEVAPNAPPAEPEAEPAPKKRRLKQLFDFLLVMDLEATCDRDKEKQLTPQEIIELSCVVVDTATCTLRPAGFQRYVRPDQHPRLTAFCTELTGITQAKVDAGVPLRVALQELDAWLREQGLLGQGKSFVPATWRDWDLKVMMASECKWRGITQPKYLSKWIDLSAVWVKHTNKRGNLRATVEAAGLQWEGRAHSAIDDARNTARLAIKLMHSGVILGVTGSFGDLDASGRFRQSTLRLTAGSSAGSGKASGVGAGGGAGGGAAAGSGRAQPRKRVFDDAGVWSGQCFCGARAAKRTVKRPGPNNGRGFWSCGRFTMTGGAGCDFFKFCSEVGPQPAAPSSGPKQRRW